MCARNVIRHVKLRGQLMQEAWSVAIKITNIINHHKHIWDCLLEIQVVGWSRLTMNHINTGAKTEAGTWSSLWRTRLLDSWARFLSHILSQVSWQVTWPRLRPQVTCGAFCLSLLKWLHKSLGPKSLGLFWNAPYCFPSDALFTSPGISINTIKTSRVNSIVTSLNAAP